MTKFTLETVKSDTNPNKYYEIRVGGDNHVYCTCPAWRFSQTNPKMCKHLKRYLGIDDNGLEKKTVKRVKKKQQRHLWKDKAVTAKKARNEVMQKLREKGLDVSILKKGRDEYDSDSKWQDLYLKVCGDNRTKRVVAGLKALGYTNRKRGYGKDDVRVKYVTRFKWTKIIVTAPKPVR